MSRKNPFVMPILKWVGGKRQLLDSINPLIPECSTYYEPFIGGGAVLFGRQPNKAVINDSNEELINVYRMIKEEPEELIAALSAHKKQNCEEYYYTVRAWDRDKETYQTRTNVERAARIIYLNKTCYNGLFRVNSSGEFNSPWGRYKNPNITNEATIHALNTYLNKANITIKCGDYREALKGIRKGAFVYFDPPYMPISSSASFTGYTAGGFGEEEQIALKEQCDMLNAKGIKFLLSNSSCEFIEDFYVLGEFDLYQDFPEIPSDIKRVTSAKIPDYFESIDLHDIRSEASAINVMSITGILDDFLGEDRMVQTVSGRMGSGNFEFYVSDYQKSEPIEKKPLIQVQNSQVEIDGGFENENVFTLIEGKNVVHSNFLIRQLYYPARLWAEKIHKPIRPVFMVYSNNIFRLLEYEFTDLRYYNSLRLVQERNYSLEEIEITLDDLYDVWARTKVKPEPAVTFIQADSFYKVISLVERLNENPMTGGEIAQLFGFKERQSDYYFNACRYLGLAEKQTDEDGVKVHIRR